MRVLEQRPGEDDLREAVLPNLAQSSESLGDALVVGATGGIGSHLVDALSNSPSIRRVFRWSRTGRSVGDGTAPSAPRAADMGLEQRVDLEREQSIIDAAAQLRVAAADLRVVFNAAGLLHEPQPDAPLEESSGGSGVRPERALRQVRGDVLRKVFAVNAIGPLLVLRHVLPMVPADARSLLISLSARVGSIEDNRLGGWYAYRGSKAALNQFHRTLAVELGRSHPEAITLLLHPGTVATELSEPFQGTVDPAKLFAPKAVAARLLRLADSATSQDSGGFFAWDGAPIPW